MPIERTLWGPIFLQEEIPTLPCPTCTNGNLALIKNGLALHEPNYSLLAEKHSDWDPTWQTQRFSATLKCDKKKCGEIVIATGETDIVEDYMEEPDGYSGWAYFNVLRPRNMFPAPPLFPLPESFPRKVTQQLRLAFQLYWNDIPSSVSRLRTSLEVMLTDMKVPETKIGKKTALVRLNLAQRIELFEKITSDSENAESMHALRHIGNLGTHGSDLDSEAYFDALDVYEDALLEIYEKKSIKLKAKKSKLITTKGSY